MTAREGHVMLARLESLLWALLQRLFLDDLHPTDDE